MEPAHWIGLVGVVLFGFGLHSKGTDIRSARNRQTPIVIGVLILALSVGWIVVEHKPYISTPGFVKKR